MCNPQPYQPTGPYFFKSGKNKVMETLLFNNYSLLKWWFLKIKGGDRLNEMQKHLKWIFEQLPKLKTVITCPHCSSSLSTKVGIDLHGDGSIIVGGHCCENCEHQLWTQLNENNDILDINFELLLISRFSKGTNRKEIITFLKKAYGIKNITAQAVFNLLKNAK